MRNLLFPLFALLLAFVLPPARAGGTEPIPGKYRCYTPPAYTVFAWFEIGEGRVRVNGDTPVPFHFDTKQLRLDWTTDGFAPYRHGLYMPVGAAGGEAERTTIVLLLRPGMRPTQAGWHTLPRCYLTTH